MVTTIWCMFDSSHSIRKTRQELDRYRGIFEGLSAGTGFVDATAGKDPTVLLKV